MANYLTNFLLGTNIKDYTNSFRLYRREIFQELSQEVHNKGFGFQMEIAVFSQWRNKRVKEIPIVFVDRCYGSSKFDLNEIRIFLRTLWRLFNTPI